jgi:SAM-dependent methyltransferase
MTMERAPREWWQGFFTGPWLQVQAAVKGDAEATRHEAEWLWETLGLAPGARVLDAPCGSGRHAVELAGRGATVVGLDISDEVIALARERASERGVAERVELWQRDMRDLPEDGSFDGAYCWWGSFGFFDEAGNARFLEAVANSLAPGARFALDVFLLETIMRRWQGSSLAADGEVLFGEIRQYDPATSRVESEWHLVASGRQQVRRGSIRIYTYRELMALLESAGFTDVAVQADLDGTPWRLGHGRSHVVATRATREA